MNIPVSQVVFVHRSSAIHAVAIRGIDDLSDPFAASAASHFNMFHHVNRLTIPYLLHLFFQFT